MSTKLRPGSTHSTSWDSPTSYSCSLSGGAEHRRGRSPVIRWPLSPKKRCASYHGRRRVDPCTFEVKRDSLVYFKKINKIKKWKIRFLKGYGSGPLFDGMNRRISFGCEIHLHTRNTYQRLVPSHMLCLQDLKNSRVRGDPVTTALAGAAFLAEGLASEALTVQLQALRFLASARFDFW